MKLQIEDRISEIADKARIRYDEALDRARTNTKLAAGRVSKGKRPVRAISRFGVKLSGVSHRTANKIWKRQTKLVEDQFDAVAGHLKAAANATDLRNLLKAQIELIPNDTSRFRDEAVEVFDIVKGAGSEIRGIFKDTVDEFRNRKPAAKKAAPSKAPVVPASSTASDKPALVGEEVAA